MRGLMDDIERRNPNQDQWWVAGAPVEDHYLNVNSVSLTGNQVCFQAGGQSHAIRYRGRPLEWGGKRTADKALGVDYEHIEQAVVKNGGGSWNSAAHLAKLRAKRGLPIQPVVVDLTIPWSGLRTESEALGIRHLGPEIQDPSTNIVLTKGGGAGTADRVILKSPQPPEDLEVEHALDLLRQFCDGVSVVLINSPKSSKLAKLLLIASQVVKALQYVVLTTSLPIELRLEFFCRSQASVCNLSEFAEIAHELGLSCASDEANAPLLQVARAMVIAGRLCRIRGDLVVTLGARGCLVYERMTGEVNYIGLQAPYRNQVQTALLAQPERKNGAGDRFFATFVLAHVLNEGHGRAQATRAALEASLDAVRTLVPELRPEQNWMDLHLLSKPIFTWKANGGL